MPFVKSLPEQLESAWAAAISEDYCSHRINSERSLQASCWSHLNELLPIETHRIFIEPAFSVMIDGELKTVYPDLVVCGRGEIVAVVELKYQPRKQPRFRKDVETLAALANGLTDLRLKHRRYRGPEFEEDFFTFAESALFAWAGVHAENGKSKPTLFNRDIAALHRRYLQLHAITRHDKAPRIVALRG